jgi:ACS family hexuronate transporter-like MFS transporter
MIRPGGRVRWIICALLFFATTINYLDRQVFSVLGPTLGARLGFDRAQYGEIGAAFQVSYAVGLLVVGRFVDRVGSRAGLSLAVVCWSLAAVAHAFACSAGGFAVARAALGFAEAGNFPGAVKTVAEWFPKRERALATGIFNAGSNVGATVAPLLVPRIAAIPVVAGLAGWRWAFVATGAAGFVWLAAWLHHYRRPEEHPALSTAELAHIRSDPPDHDGRVPWLHLLSLRQTWAFAVGKLLTDPIWWFYLTWLPMYLEDTYGMSLSTFGPPLVVIYLMADAGSVAGGSLASLLIARGLRVPRARRLALLICAVLASPVIFASQARRPWIAVLFIGLAAAAHQGWSTNLFTLVGDTFPRRAVASVVGIGGLCGSIGGALFQIAVGRMVQRTGSYHAPFFMAGSAYLLALLFIHLLSPAKVV